MTGAGNQQESMRAGWVVGFVDGEGTFSVAIQRNREMSLGWQVFPEFVVTQSERSIAALNELKEFFQCGQIYRNRRYDNHREDIFRYCVRNRSNLEEKIVPFFTTNRLKTSKVEDFEKFKRILDGLKAKKHLKPEGLKEIAEIARTMNRRRQIQFSLSPETVCQTPPQGGEDTVRAPWRHGEAGRNDRPTWRTRQVP